MELKLYKAQYFKHFLKQGSFALHHCKEMDNFIKKALDIVLINCFESFLPPNDKIPLCIIANKQYAKFSLCANEVLPLLFIYKDVEAYHIKSIIKALIVVLNDIHLQIDYVIIELDGLKNIAKNELKQNIIQTRFICGCKPLFKDIKECFENALKEEKEHFASELLNKLSLDALPFLKQEFDIKKDFGGLNTQRNLDDLLTLFKNSPKNYALNFIDEKDLSELRLASDFLMSLKSAMNLQANKDENIFLLNNIQEIAQLMYKKDKKNLKASEILVQKALQSMHTVALYSAFLAFKIQNNNLNSDYKSFIDALNYLVLLEDKEQSFDINFVFNLKNLVFHKKDMQKAMSMFKQILYKKHSFDIVKLLLDTGFLKELFKPFMNARFLIDEEEEYSFDIQALLTLQAFEQSDEGIFISLKDEEKFIIKLVILMSAISYENEVSLASIFRNYVMKFNVKSENLELGLKLLKNYNALKNMVEKEDIFNPLIICNLLSRLENQKSLELLNSLTKLKARVLNKHIFFFKGLTRLFENAKQGFEDENLLDETTRRVKKELTLKRTKFFLDAGEYLQDKILHIKSNLFIIKNSFEDIVNIAKIAKENELKFWFSNELNLNLQVVASKGFNFEVILLALSNLNLIFMNFFELYDDKIYLKFEYDDVISIEQRNKLAQLLNSNLANFHKRKIKKPLIKKDELKFDLNYSKIYAKLNLNAKDQQGLVAFLMSNFNKFNLILCAAKIQTIRQRTRNTFIFQKNEALLNNANELINSLISE
ncbi:MULTISPECIES: nucleotidyltransferase [unclassified Campylobacter]|uniref:[protein-PII] uridylyltransferase family protein n=1 Tax=unclassified Campylobacter TaxID=2593542 RepID=UPI001CC203BE|nr:MULTISPECIES: nucleotidyltransferase [unclassified Campylobacter]